MNKYELEFKRTEEELRPRKDFTHKAAIDKLTSVVHNADLHIQNLKDMLLWIGVKGFIIGLFLGSLITSAILNNFLP